ncbi:MAG: hypothetical protein ABI718_13755, partial [Acidobacteriota bacterium]
LLDAALPEDWEIYVQPHLNGCRPDFVLLSSLRGVAVIEVKDVSKPDEAFFRRAIGTLRIYESEIEEIYCPTIEQRAGKVIASRSARLVLTNVNRHDLNAATSPGLRRRMVAADELHEITRLVPGVLSVPQEMASDVVADLRSWLDEPRCSREQRHPLFRELNAKQRTLVGQGPGSPGQRRVRGSAGSGKSLVLAARAAHLAKYEGKRGLVTSFNLTLLHYLRDLAVRYPVPERNALVNEFVTWLHFHAWCKRICFEAGMSDQYAALWRGLTTENRSSPLDSALPALTREALKISNPQYDFIMVDEGQDWQPDWWRTVQDSLRPGGEIMLVADRTQNLYGRRAKWTDSSMAGAGFRGNWTTLETSYRLPSTVIPKVRYFASRFIRTGINLPEVDPQATLVPCVVEWTNVRRGEEAGRCAEAVARLHRGDVIGERVSPPDIVLLVQDRKTGEKCVAELGRRGYKVCHTFSEFPDEQKRLKNAFFRGDARVKATTYQSFKGFENSLVVVVVTSASLERDLRGVYVALTRVRQDAAGSALMVINSTPELRGLELAWATPGAPVHETIPFSPEG